MSKIKILLSYHKPDYLFKDEILTPIHVGRKNAIEKMNDNEKLDWLLANMIGDDTGENISDKNAIFNEMTAVYWAWKNYNQIGNPDYIGFMHYRRHFVFDESLKKSSYEAMDIDENYFERIKYDKNKLETLMKDCDFACVKPQWRKSVYEHFKVNHEISDLDTAIAILKNKYPEYANAAEEYLKGNNAFFCNMFIFSKEIFFRYAEWFFDITLELIKQIDFSGKRLFVSEWLTGIFITKLLKEGKKGKFFPMMIAEGEHEIPVVLASDDTYAYPMLVTIASILKNAHGNTAYTFYLLISNEFSDENKVLIERVCKSNQKCKYHFIQMEDAYNEANISIQHITKATYYRLKLPSLLKNVGKCIYLDVDIVVKDDLSELYRTCIDDKYIAGVRALGYFDSDEKIENKKNELEISSLEEYVNAGVLLMNLNKMRQDNLEEKFDRLIERNFPSQDQDILNAACYSKIRRLHFKFNAMTKYPLLNENAYNDIPYIQKYIDKEEWDEGRKTPVVIHFADKIKPWNDLGIIYASEWWKIVQLLPEDICLKIFLKYFPVFSENAFKCKQEKRVIYKIKNNTLEQNENFFIKKIKGGVKCIKEHGLFYTLKLFLKKCGF